MAGYGRLAAKRSTERPVELALFYYTLLMLLVSILVAAVCLSSYLVSRKKTMLFLSVAFAFYFFDISLVFQDEFIVRSSGDALTSGYLVIRSLASVLTGGGFVTAFWVLLCDYLNETRRSMFVVPPAVFAVASIATLVFLPDGDLQRFWFWSIRQFYIYWILLYAGYSFLRQKDEAERARMWRHRGLYAVAWLLGLIVLAEDAVSFLMMDLPLVNLGSIIFSAERSYAENLLMLVIGVAAVVLGLALLLWPSHTLVIAAVLLGIYFVVSGVVRIVSSIVELGLPAGWRVLNVFVGILLSIRGVVVLKNAALTGTTMMQKIPLVVGIGWIIEGVTALLESWKLPKAGWSVLYAIVSVIAGLIVLFAPLSSAMWLMVFGGIALIVMGVASIVRAFSFGRTPKAR